MKWRITRELEDERKRLGLDESNFQKWFAWYPVTLAPGEVKAWLCFVRRTGWTRTKSGKIISDRPMYFHYYPKSKDEL